MTVASAFLFDLDGTLVGTWEANYLAYRDAFGEFGHALSPEDWRTTWGEDSRRFVPRLLPHASPQEVTAIRESKAIRYEDHLDSITLNEPLANFLRYISPDHKTALVTTAKRLNATQALGVHNLEPLFDVLVFGDDLAKSKPDPECYLLALELLGVRASEAVAFEDTATGMASALAAGLQVVKVQTFE
jgi:beta-phosphoglucomutase